MTEGHTKHGKWSQPGVPHKGWRWVGVEDLEEPSQVCGMCESVEIRYVHFMEHPDYPDTLGVGCICAEHMADDYVGPSQHEKKLKSKVHRRATWAKRKWNTSAKGNPFLNTEGFNLTIFRRADAAGRPWGVRVANRQSGKERLGARRHDSLDAAKRAALDALFWAKDHLAN
jgi:hypothetical protein